MNKNLFAAALLACSLPLQAADLTHNGCRYQGETEHGKPHGRGALSCPDGRIYTGNFAAGEFHGSGQYVAPAAASVFLAPFGMRSGKVKGMVLSGRFQNGLAHGRFKVLKGGEHLFDMDFERGMIKSITAPKK